MVYKVQLLGVPVFSQGGQLEDIPPSQALLLTAYLAYSERWLSRQAVAGFFWPDGSEKTARHNLSQLLYACKNQIWTQGLEVERSRIRYAADTDLTAFRANIAQGNWQAAVKHYRGEFLASISGNVSAEFEAWLSEARRDLHSSWREAALTHSQALLAVADHAAAAELLESILQHDELAEDVLQHLLFCSAELGENKRQRALRRFERFAQTLRSELAMEPLADTLALVEVLKEKPATLPPPPFSSPKATLYNFPSYSTGFIGRDLEQVELGTLLQQPDTQLVTLLGPGGIGKTRLAVHLAKAQARHFVDGAVYVPLAALNDAEQVASTLLRALAAKESPHLTVREQVLAHLRDKTMLLVFDNFEPVIEAADLLQDLLETSPNSRILTTSREALELPSEHLYDLAGLSFPSTLESVSEDYDAVKLFLRTAQRFQPAFSLDTGTKVHLLELCRLLEGSALGLELAASWLRVLTVEEVVQEIRANLDFLAADHSDVPVRHQSLRAVFDYSWQLLSSEEQRALARLSVFRGGFVRDAAQAVVDVSARTLLSLVNKSLLQRTPTGRFERHATVYQFSAEKLPAADRQTYRRRHATYFAGLAKQFKEATNSSQETAQLERVRSDLDNVRAALSYSLDTRATELGMGMAVDLRQFWYRAGLVAEGKALFEALLALPQASVEPHLRAWCYEVSGELNRLSGTFGEARRLFEQSLQLFFEQGDEKNSVHVFNGLGIAAYLDGDPAAARRAWQEGLAFAERLENKTAIANLSVSLGFLAKDDEDYHEMFDLFSRALVIYEQMNHPFAIMTTKSNLGFAALHQEDFETSWRFQREALSMALELKHDDSIIRCLEDLASLAAACGEAALALQLAATTAAQREALSLPIEPHDQASLEGYLAPAQAALDETVINKAVQRGQAMTLRGAAQKALDLEFALQPSHVKTR